MRRVWVALVLLWPALPASAFDPERDQWLLPPESAQTERDARRLYSPLDFARIRADGNYVEPQYAADMEQGLVKVAGLRDPAAAKALLDVGTNPNRLTAEYGRRALLLAVDAGNVETVRLLLDAGADPDLADGSGYTPLGLAALRGYARIVLMLLRAGANPDLKSKDGNTPMTAAASMNRVAVIRELLKYRPDLTLHNLEGRTALSVAAMEGYEEALLAMLEAGADPNLRDKNGNTPLFWAGYIDNVPMQRMLLKHGASTQ